MITCMFQALLPVRQSLMPLHGGVTHPLQPTWQARSQIKQLIFRRLIFYVQDFLAQRPISSFKELD